MKQQLLDLSGSTYGFTRTGLITNKPSTVREWETMGEGLRAIDEARQWAIGDWLVDGKRHYADGLYKRASEITGIDSNTLEQFASMASRIEYLCRHKCLTFEHHKQVVSVYSILDNEGHLKLGGELDTEKVGEFLDEAKKYSWTVAQLRVRVRNYKERQREQIRLANDPDKCSVIYADPPWQYTSGDQHSTEEQETTLGDHYPSMPLADICSLPVEHRAAKDCVLWLWSTSPTLEEAFQVVKAWGFEYKASMIWDKVDHNVGNYVSVRHEILLICTRGQPPKVPNLVDSVVEIKRSEHSRKPDYFRELIDTLYPDGNRLEMFRRGDAPDGWEIWGDEADE